MKERTGHQILTLDGGGSWALIQVMALQSIYGEDTGGHEVLQHFDYVAANSGGSIVTAGLIADMPLSEILQLFEHQAHREAIFQKLPWSRWLGAGKVLAALNVGPRYRSSAKLTALQARLGKWGAMRLDDLNTVAGRTHPIRVSFATYDYARRRARFLRNFDSKASAWGSGASTVTLAGAVHASTNAPIRYFDEPATVDQRHYWDGGLTGYNNPVLAAVVELVANDGLQAAANAAVLSLGTATVVLPEANHPQEKAQHPALLSPQDEPGLFADIKKVSTTILQDPPDAHSFIAHMMLGGGLPDAERFKNVPSPVVRMNPLIQGRRDGQGIWQLPLGIDEVQFKALVAMDMDAVQDHEVKLIKLLCQQWMAGHVNNQAVRAGSDLGCEIGDSSFAQAKARWLS